MRKKVRLRNYCFVLILGFTLVIIGIHVGQAQVETKGKPDKPPKPPEPSPSLMLEKINIITTEPDGGGRLRVWGNKGEFSYEYENIWTVESVHHGSVAIGNVDADNFSEIVLPGYCQKTEGKGKSRKTYYEIYLNVYKEGISGVWQSTHGTDFVVREDKNFWFSEITIADIGGIQGNEIILITRHNLAVFKYNGSEFELIAHDNFDDRKLHSITVGDVDNDSENEIVVSANSVSESGAILPNVGHLLTYQYSEGGLYEESDIMVNANLSNQSLRIGDIEGDGESEICSTGYRYSEDSGDYQSVIFIWSLLEEGYRHDYIYGQPLSDIPGVILDVGDLTSNQGDEIVVATNNPDNLELYNVSLLDSKISFEFLWKRDFPEYYSVSINNILIVDVNGDSTNEIVVSGGGSTGERNSGAFYLEVVDNDGSTRWFRLGGERGEHSIWYATVGEEHPPSDN